jgi:hypothetical protein
LILEKGKILSVTLFLQLLDGDEPERRRVHAVTQTGRGRSIIEDVPQM